MEIVLSCGIEQRSLLGIKDANFAEAESCMAMVLSKLLILFKSSYQTKRGSLNLDGRMVIINNLGAYALS